MTERHSFALFFFVFSLNYPTLMDAELLDAPLFFISVFNRFSSI